MTRRNSRHEPPEVASLLNPAFVALLLARACRGHQADSQTGMPYVYSTIIFTMASYSTVRESLPRSVSTKFVNWVTENPPVRASLPMKIAGLVPIVNEGLLFALQNRIVEISNARLFVGPVGPTQTIQGDSTDMIAAQRAATYLGRWLTRAGTPATVCALIGVTP